MFEAIAWVFLGIAFICAIVVAIDLMRHPQKMGIMNIVWPVTALYGSVFALRAYFRYGRRKAKDLQKPMSEEEHKKMMKDAKEHPKPNQIGVAASPCGAGCTLGDIVADFIIFGFALTLWARTFGRALSLITFWRDARDRLSILHHRPHAWTVAVPT